MEIETIAGGFLRTLTDTSEHVASGRSVLHRSLGSFAGFRLPFWSAYGPSLAHAPDRRETSGASGLPYPEGRNARRASKRGRQKGNPSASVLPQAWRPYRLR